MKGRYNIKIWLYNPYQYSKDCQEDNLNVLIWNVKSLNDMTKSIYLSDVNFK